jgi:hypothetical protein
VMTTIPLTLNTSGNPNSTTWNDLATRSNFQNCEDYWYAMGRRIRAAMAHYNKDSWQLLLRPNHEMNQSNSYQVYTSQVADYGVAMKKMMAAFRSGYGTVNRGYGAERVKFIFSPSRALNIGPLAGFFSTDSNGNSLYDAVDVSCHPAAPLNIGLGKTDTEQEDICWQWMRGQIDDRGYAADHTDTARSQIAHARAFNIPICYTEWSPRYDEPNANGCYISSAFYRVMHQWLSARADAGELAFDAVFRDLTLAENDSYAQNWAAGARTFKALWKGDVGELNPLP